jgi:putative transposase
VEQYVSELVKHRDHDAPPMAVDSQPAATRVYIGARDWPHAPLHRLSEHGTHIVTAGTLYKEHIFRSPDRLDLLESILLSKAKESCWQFEAWAVFSNHYHFVAHALAGCCDLASFIKGIHGETAVAVNRLDRQPGRRVWCNYRDTELTYEKSYYARLNYVHHNAVKHGLVVVANQYRWCSAAWFERTATPAQVRTIYGFPTGKVKVQDDFEPIPPE